MSELVIGGLVTLVVTLAAQAIARGGRRRRNLADAGRELDVAAKLPDGSPQKKLLESRANDRIDLYNRPPADVTIRWVTRLVFLLGYGLVVIGGIALLFPGDPKPPGWVILIPSAIAGFAFDSVENFVVARVRRRRARWDPAAP